MYIRCSFSKNNMDNIKTEDDNTNDENVRKNCILIRQNRVSVKMYILLKDLQATEI